MRRILLLGAMFALGFTVWSSHSLLAEATKETTKKAAAPAPAKTPDVAPAASTNGTAKATVSDRALNQEILDLLQSRYADPALLTSKKINQAAILGVLASLDTSAQILDPTTLSKPDTSHPAINSVTILPPAIGYVRWERVDEGSAKMLESEIQKLIKEKQVAGLIIDLRFAQGSSFAAIPPAAAIFLPTSMPLFEIQRNAGSEKFEAAKPAFTTELPLSILINGDTSQAGEAFAAVLQEQSRALVIGASESAGRAFETTDVKLSNGQILRLATGKVKLARGSDLFLKGLKPDVKVVMDKQLEKQIYDKPFVGPDIKPEAHLFSEAILTGHTTPPPLTKDKDKKEPEEPPTNQDMVLLRAIDWLKTIQNLGLTTTEQPFTGAYVGNSKG